MVGRVVVWGVASEVGAAVGVMGVVGVVCMRVGIAVGMGAVEEEKVLVERLLAGGGVGEEAVMVRVLGGV